MEFSVVQGIIDISDKFINLRVDGTVSIYDPATFVVGDVEATGMHLVPRHWLLKSISININQYLRKVVDNLGTNCSPETNN